jgi:hypothetical protein
VAPQALRRARRKTVHVRLVIHTLLDPVNPAVAQRLIDRLDVRDATLRRMLLVKADPQLGRGVVMLIEPAPERGRGSKEDLSLPHFLTPTVTTVLTEFAMKH